MGHTMFFLNTLNILLYSEYFIIVVYVVIALVLAVIIVSLSYLLMVQNPETEKLSTYECGFEPYEDARNSFEIKFYLIAILFIVFDIETMFLLPWTASLAFCTTLVCWCIRLGIKKHKFVLFSYYKTVTQTFHV